MIQPAISARIVCPLRCFRDPPVCDTGRPALSGRGGCCTGRIISYVEETENLPGITLSLVSWLVISIGFSVHVENFGKYSIIYGALGTVIVLLIWLYMTSFLLILGAEFNAALAQAGESMRASCSEIQPFINRIIS